MNGVLNKIGALNLLYIQYTNILLESGANINFKFKQ